MPRRWELWIHAQTMVPSSSSHGQAAHVRSMLHLSTQTAWKNRDTVPLEPPQGASWRAHARASRRAPLGCATDGRPGIRIGGDFSLGRWTG